MTVPAAACLDDRALTRLLAEPGSSDDDAAAHAHLDECAACAAAMLALVRGSTTAQAPPPTQLGRFVVQDRLGSGAMGTVFTAWDPQLGRPVAIKVLRAGRAQARDAARLLREARSMAQVRHPNVVTVYEVGQDRDVVFVAMERITGATLRAAALDATPARALGWLTQAAHGLSAVHAAGLAHRDIKPDNIFIEGERAVIGDFGLATSGDAASGADSPGGELTTRSAGTPAYMAPEQLAGELADTRSDVFAFGVTAWEVLTGARPYQGRTVEELGRAIAAGPPPRPAAVSPRLGAMLGRCVDPARARRPATMTAVIAALEAERHPRRRRRSLAAGVGAAAAVATIITWRVTRSPAQDRATDAAVCEPTRPATWRRHASAWPTAAAALSPATRAEIAATMERRAADWSREATAACAGDALARVAWTTCRERVEHDEDALVSLATERAWPDDQALARAFDELDPPASCRSREAAEDAVELARLTPSARQDVLAGLSHLSRARALSDVDAIEVELDAAAARAQRAGATMLDGELALARAELRPPDGAAAQVAALEAVAASAERSGRASLIARAWLALVTRASDVALAATTVDNALAQAEWAIDRLGRPAHLRVPWLVLRAEELWTRGERTEATKQLADAIALAGDDPYLAGVRTQAVARIASLTGDDGAAAATYRALLDDPALMATIAPRERIRLWSLLAECQYRLDQNDLAATAIGLALDEGSRIFAADDPMQITNQIIAASIAYERGDAAGALATLASARAAALRAFGADHLTLSHIELRRAQVLRDTGARAEALAAVREAQRISDARLGRRSELSVMGRGFVAEALVDAGDLPAALRAYAEADADGREVYGATHPMWAQSVPPYARALSRAGQGAEARRRLEEALPVLIASGFAPDITSEARFELAKLCADDQPARARALAQDALADASDDQRPVIAAWLGRARGRQAP